MIGTFNTLKAAFPELKKTKGCIINISATLHYTGSPFQAHAVSAKAGIDAMTKTLAVEWGRYGVRINCIAPGPIEDTEGFRKLTPKDMDRSLVSRMVPLGTFGKIQDIENAALFLTSEGGRWITGAVMVVDGGSWLGGDEPFRTSFGNNLSKL